MARPRPRVFVGSSSEGLPIAKSVQRLLDHSCEVKIWSQGVFGLSQGTLESLVAATDDFDFAVLVLTPDDMVEKRGQSRPAARDNVVFELGLFMGSLGRSRTFLVYDRTANLNLPSDLAGVTAATFEPHSTGDLKAALGSACSDIEDAVARIGFRESRKVKELEAATRNVQTAGDLVQRLVHLLARSRRVELDVIASQFGGLIDPKHLREIVRDLDDLERTLASSADGEPVERPV